LMYDESFKWLFNAFLSTHNQKQPQTIFSFHRSGYCYGKGCICSEVFTSTWHGLFTWHISQNALKHLCSNEEESQNEEESNNEEIPSILFLSDFTSCMYEYEKRLILKRHLMLWEAKLVNQLGWTAFTGQKRNGLSATCWMFFH
jgi:hypothetical protein